MLTVDLDRLGLGPGNTLLDMGCGGGRHAFAALRRGATVVALDADGAELKQVHGTIEAMIQAGELPAATIGTPVQGDALALPFADGAFDRIIASEVLEHIPDDVAAIDELARVLAPGGRLAVTVPARLPERINWLLDDEYHDFPGGHIRIYRQRELEQRLARRGARGSRRAARARPPLAVLVDPLRRRCQQRRPPRRAPVSRCAGLADHEEPAGPRVGGPPAQPGHRQEPDRVRGEAVLTPAELAATVDAIARVQADDGRIPWVPDGKADPWNLVEAAMALDVGGRHDEAARAYAWLLRMQLPNGGWHAYYVGDGVSDATLDTNISAYVATGAWHHYLSTDDASFLRQMWPVVEAAIDHVLEFQAPSGEIAWRADDPADGALLTGSSSIHLSLRCAIAIAERLGHERPDWELSAAALATAIAHRPDVFMDKSRWAMDWYYPILGGVLRGEAARRRIEDGWAAFVVEGLGVRCVSDRPWVTAAETCELVMALDAIGETDRAREVFGWVRFLRHADGGYWCGMNFEGERFDEPGEYFTADQPTWNSAAVVLAAHALDGSGPAAGLFRGAATTPWPSGELSGSNSRI